MVLASAKHTAVAAYTLLVCTNSLVNTQQKKTPDFELPQVGFKPMILRFQVMLLLSISGLVGCEPMFSYQLKLPK